ncbi:CaiB/BaiF CoA transferase family protein [Achromobacter insolitus]|uniref:CaiB/BaiF CoA transferase family protein n=1 Tax=Achromobacter insolitus TaxID=217204 RepID=UPI0028AC7FA3|nr:CoA transferase [Achromobacter insolitus]
MSALTGLKVLELGTLIAGPFAARIFGEFGADVIKVETPHGPDGSGGGDPIRSWRHLHEGNSLWWTVQARNKQSIALNLKDPRAREIARQLALDADVVVENYRPGVLEKWGLGYEQLRAVNPALIMVRLSGYGQTGPMKDQPGFGAIGDSIAALHGVIGAMMALRHRDATGGRWNGKQGADCQAGQGQMVDVALYEAVFNMMESLVPEYDVAGVVRERTGGALPGIVPSNTYTTRDGQNIVIAGNGDAIFHRLMRAIGRDDLATDPALVRNDGRARRVEEIDGAIQQWCGARGIEEALGILKGADVPVGKIYSVADMFSDPQFLARRMIEQHRFPDGTPVKLPAVVPKLSETPGETRWVGPRLGEHTEEVLKSLGYDSAAIEELAKTGAIGLPDN